MAESEHITVSFPEAVASRIRAAVQAGEYGSMSEAVQDAVRIWSDQRQAGEQDIVDLQRAWDAGKAGGTHGQMDFGELRREAREQLKAKTASAF